MFWFNRVCLLLTRKVKTVMSNQKILLSYVNRMSPVLTGYVYIWRGKFKYLFMLETIYIHAYILPLYSSLPLTLLISPSLTLFLSIKFKTILTIYLFPSVNNVAYLYLRRIHRSVRHS